MKHVVNLRISLPCEFTGEVEVEAATREEAIEVAKQKWLSGKAVVTFDPMTNQTTASGRDAITADEVTFSLLAVTGETY